MNILKFIFFKKIKISYGITVCNEAEEINRLLKCLILNKDKNDEIIVLSDKTNVTTQVLNIIDSYKENIKHISFPLNKDFSTFKNNLINSATGDYLFQIDADEIPDIYLLKKLKFLLFRYIKYDCFLIPRANFIEGITKEHIKKWNWTIDKKNRINYPDLQRRLFKMNKGIRWTNKVHEVLVNWSKAKVLPYKKNENLCLFHIKEIKKQESQNNFYDTIS